MATQITKNLPSESKSSLLARGAVLAARFCEANGLPQPAIQEWAIDSWRFNVCAYYDRGTIHLCLAKCAAIGTTGRAWSFPGYAVDRTPYGVIQHEVGHHADVLKASPGKPPGRYWSDYSASIRLATKEAPLTGYCENDAEWFAEIFRLFISNPDLLRRMRPLTFEHLQKDGFKPVFQDDWTSRLAGAPERTLTAAQNRIGNTQSVAQATQPCFI